MHRGYKVMRGMVYSNPSLLPTLPKNLVYQADQMMRRSVGIEIECQQKNEYSSYEVGEILRKIPGVMASDVDSGEKRFRIISGSQGMIALYKICDALKQTCLLNPQSGIHYHIDFSWSNYWKVYSYNTREYFLQTHEFWILKALESWNYTGKYNEWKVSQGKTAVKFHDIYNTIEFRIGEMTFDYEVMIQRILHAQRIVEAIDKKFNLYVAERRISI